MSRNKRINLEKESNRITLEKTQGINTKKSDSIDLEKNQNSINLEKSPIDIDVDFGSISAEASIYEFENGDEIKAVASVDISPINANVDYNVSTNELSIGTEIGIPLDILEVGAGLFFDMETGEVTGGSVSVSAGGVEVEVSKSKCEVTITTTYFGVGFSYSKNTCEEEENDNSVTVPPPSLEEPDSIKTEEIALPVGRYALCVFNNRSLVNLVTGATFSDDSPRTPPQRPSGISNNEWENLRGVLSNDSSVRGILNVTTESRFYRENRLSTVALQSSGSASNFVYYPGEVSLPFTKGSNVIAWQRWECGWLWRAVSEPEKSIGIANCIAARNTEYEFIYIGYGVLDGGVAYGKSVADDFYYFDDEGRKRRIALLSRIESVIPVQPKEPILVEGDYSRYYPSPWNDNTYWRVNNPQIAFILLNNEKKPKLRSPLPPTKEMDQCCAAGISLSRQIWDLLGGDEFPAKLPEKMVQKVKNEKGELEEIKEKEILNYAELMGWYIDQIDGYFGQWEIPIKVEDADPSKPGNQPEFLKLTNLSEAIAELFGLISAQSTANGISLEILNKLAVENMLLKQSNHRLEVALKELLEFLEMPYDEKEEKIPAEFKIGAENLGEFLQDSTLKTKVISRKEGKGSPTLMDKIDAILEAANIIKAQGFRKINPYADIATQVAGYMIKGALSQKDTAKGQSAEDNNFDDFIDDVESNWNRVENLENQDTSRTDNPRIIKLNKQATVQQEEQ